MADNNQNPVRQMILASEFASKAKSKREIFVFLSTNVMAYLPDFHTATIYFLKELISGSKKYVKQSHVRHIYCPQYEGLTICEVMKLVDQYPQLQVYFPTLELERKRLQKQWILNVAYSVVGEDFAAWVKQGIELRNQKLASEKNLLIEVDADIANAFHRSTSVSLSKGIGANLLKIGTKRRRTTAQIKDSKLQEEQSKVEMDAKLQQFNQLQQQIANLEAMVKEHQGASEIIKDLMQKGEIDIDQEGNVSTKQKYQN